MRSVRTLYGVPQQLGAFAGSTPLLGGDAGTAQTVSLAKKLVDAAVKDPAVNALAIAIVRPTPNYDNLSKAQAFFDWTQENVRYVPDPVGPYGAKETLRPMRDLMVLLAGDCDDINMVFLPALLGSVGISSRVVTIKADPEVPHEYSHVYCEALIDGVWIPMDCARPNAIFGEEPPRYWARKEWPMADAPITLMGMGCADGVCGCGGGCAASASRGLSGYVIDMPGGMGRLGDDSTTAQDITAATSGAAAVISAANQNPYSYLYTLNTPSAPSMTAPQLGYGVPGIGASVQFSSYLPLIIGGLVLLALVGGGRR